MKNKKIKHSLSLLLGLALIIYTVNFFYHAVNESSKNSIKLEKEMPADYLNIFNSQAQKNLVLQTATSFRLRSTIADLVYNDKYDIMVSRITVQPDFSIRTHIIEIYGKPKGIPAEPYVPYGGNDFRINYNSVSNGKVSNIYVTLYGDSTHIYHKNDTVAYYYSDLKEGYVQYKPEGTYEVSIKSKNKLYFFRQNKPIILMFLKKSDFVYFITLRNREGNKVLNPDLLYKLIKL